MKVAELFVELGVKGSEKALNSVKQVGDFLTDVSAKGLAAKAAIIGAVYALERLTVSSGEYGAGISNLSTLTGVNDKYIMQLEEAYRWYGNLGDAAESAAQSTIRAASKIQQEMIIEGEPPRGLMQAFSEMNVQLQRAETDVPYLLEKMRGYVRKHAKDISPVVVNAFTEAFGEGFVVTARSMDKDVSSLTRNIPSRGLVEKSAQIRRAWADFKKQFSLFELNLAGEYGAPVIKFLDEALAKVGILINKMKEVTPEEARKKKEEERAESAVEIREEFEARYPKEKEIRQRMEAEHPELRKRRWEMEHYEPEQHIFPEEIRPFDIEMKELGDFIKDTFKPMHHINVPHNLPGRTPNALNTFHNNIYLEGSDNNREDAMEIHTNLMQYALRQGFGQGQVT